MLNDLLACIAGRHHTPQGMGKGTDKGKKNMTSATTTQSEAEPVEATVEGQGAKRAEDEKKTLQYNHNSSHANQKLYEWDEGNMKEALRVGLDLKKAGEKVSIKQLSRDYDVPDTTLRRRINDGDPENYKHAHARKRSLPPEGMFKISCLTE